VKISDSSVLPVVLNCVNKESISPVISNNIDHFTRSFYSVYADSTRKCLHMEVNVGVFLKKN
jgi:hypothetical protein